MRDSILAWCAVGAVGAAITGCAPETPYRYTALVPSARPIAWDGVTAKEGSFHIEGTVGHGTVHSNYAPQVHDTAVLVPGTMIEGTAAIALTQGLELGAHAAYGNYEWSNESAVGTMPLPSAPSLWGFGPELRGSFPLDQARHFRLGLAGNFMRYDIPYAEWTRTGQPDSPGGKTTRCTPSPTCVGEYALFTEETEAHWTASFGIYPSYSFGDHGEHGRVFAVLGGHTGFKNDGFTDKPTNGSTVSGTGPIWILGGGYGVDVDIVHIQGLLYKPITDNGSPVNYGPGGMLSVGVNLEMWQAAKAD